MLSSKSKLRNGKNDEEEEEEEEEGGKVEKFSSSYLLKLHTQHTKIRSNYSTISHPTC